MGTIVDEQITILVVDDEPHLRDIYRDFLSSCYKVVAAIDGSQALEIMDQRSIDLVVTDMNMPNLNGEGLRLAMSSDARLVSIPIVACTANPEDANSFEFVLEKPFSEDELICLVEKARSKLSRNCKNVPGGV